MTSRLRSGLFVLAALLWSRTGHGQVLQTFPDSYPAGIALGSDGAIWSVDSGLGTFIRIENGTTQDFRTTQRNVLSMAAGPDGNIWFTNESGVRRITTDGVVTTFNYDNAWPLHIAAGPDGNMWFTEYNANRIGRITPAGQITWFDVPTASAGVVDITTGPDGNLWFTENLSTNRIGRISTLGVITEFPLSAGHFPQYITAGKDGNVWFTSTGHGYGATVGRITPNGEITEFPLPAGASSIAAGPDGSLWLGGYGFLMRVTQSGEVTSIPFGDALRPIGFVFPSDGTMWFAAAGDDSSDVTGAIVQFCAGGAACVPEDAFRLQDGRFALTVDWTTRTGATGRGHGVQLTSSSA